MSFCKLKSPFLGLLFLSFFSFHVFAAEAPGENFRLTWGILGNINSPTDIVLHSSNTKDNATYQAKLYQPTLETTYVDQDFPFRSALWITLPNEKTFFVGDEKKSTMRQIYEVGTHIDFKRDFIADTLFWTLGSGVSIGSMRMTFPTSGTARRTYFSLMAQTALTLHFAPVSLEIGYRKLFGSPGGKAKGGRLIIKRHDATYLSISFDIEPSED